ncbi:MAG TPA: amylo-alpha-1,6-glucosidase [Syntrophales bacterium]|nr:amylo-alpha-1,6-glucosidase [Syntrophales bacterium]
MIRVVTREKKKTEDLLEKEWLETNGLGGYASSSVFNCHTRKYHGLLVSRLEEPAGRFVLLSKVEDTFCRGDRTWPLSLHTYRGVPPPVADFPLSEVVLGAGPSFRYRFDEGGLRKEIVLLKEKNTLVIRYALEAGAPGGVLRVRPFLAFRDIHRLMKENTFLRTETTAGENGFSVRPYDGMPALFCRLDPSPSFYPEPLWYRNFEYREEEARGFPCYEDLFTPGVLEALLLPGAEAFFMASLEEEISPPKALWQGEVGRRKKQALETKGKKINLSPFLGGAGQFLIRDGAGRRAVIAGYPWFYVWGRDTLISLPGLTFCLGRVEEGREILLRLGEQRRDGLLPNCLSETGAPAYNTADASLWYFWCVQQFLETTGDLETVRDLFWPVLADLARGYLEGRAEGIRFLQNGLLSVGDSETQLTWMDATVRGKPVTPRNGCPVEINALWYNALAFLEQLSETLGEPLFFDGQALLSRVEASFLSLFTLPGEGYLADTADPVTGGRDRSLRPNQIFALSLPFPVLRDRDLGKQVVETVTEALLTPFGLRTLSPRDPAYRPVYAGGPEERDAAYHQGTVWPWLNGHYGKALLRFCDDREAARSRLSQLLRNLTKHLSDAGLGTVSEIFDGESPHRPRGCIAQAWSVAETIRLAVLLGENS